jgi:hypothetical protein
MPGATVAIGAEQVFQRFGAAAHDANEVCQLVALQGVHLPLDIDARTLCETEYENASSSLLAAES